jgi:hypothetical protein
MFRYLTSAFWARPRIWGLGRIPWNALAVAGAAILGFGEHSVWLGGLGVETLYLFVIATNPGFQRWVDERDMARVHGETEEAKALLVQSLGGAARQRLIRLDEKVAKIEKLYRESPSDNFLFDTNRDALKKLAWAFLKLLVAQRNLIISSGQSSDTELRAQIDAIEKELASGVATEAVRTSKKATATILRQRIDNIRRRAETLAEVDADLARVEAQIDLALEEANLKEQPAAISANIDLVSRRMLDEDYGEAGGAIATLDQKYNVEQH